MIRQLASWNWAGIVFVAAMLALIGFSGWITRWLREWAEKDETVRTYRGWIWREL